MAELLERLQQALVDRYCIERELGAGGMATVYLATDLRHGRTVALKVLRPELSVALGPARFLREIKTTAQLAHPHILPLLDSGEAVGTLFYAMPFVEGESLRRRLEREKQLPLDDALRITCEVGDALAYAHGHGVVHRDIKPENILLSGGHAVLADFGIARAASMAGSESLTATGMTVGTPLYMSPEQSVGAANIDGRADIYSLACVLYEMLAGDPPFAGSTAQAVLAKHSAERPPSVRIVRQLVPEGIDATIQRAMAKSPADRFETAAAFTAALTIRDLRSGAASRRRAVLVGLAAAVLVAMSLVAVLAHDWRPGKPNARRNPARVALANLDDLSGDGRFAAIAYGVPNELSLALQTSPDLTVLSHDAVEASMATSPDPLVLAEETGAGTLVFGSVRATADGIGITVRVVDGNSGAVVDSVERSAPKQRLLTLGAVLAEQLVGFLETRLGHPLRTVSMATFGATESVEAWELVQRADQAVSRQRPDVPRDSAIGALRSADALLARAEALDPRWIRVPILRARDNYLLSRTEYEGTSLDAVGASQKAVSSASIAAGLRLAGRALVLDSGDAEALTVRGNLRYWKWLLELEPDSAAASELLRAARRDLEAAVKRNPSEADAWATLSHLYYQDGSLSDVYRAARRSYETNPLLDNAEIVLSRLFYSSFDLEVLSDAERWCAEGARRFPSSYRFVECRLLLMAFDGKPADVRLAWHLLDSALTRTPADGRPYQLRYDQLLVAGVLGRVGLADSARHLVDRALADSAADPTRDLAFLGAEVLLHLGDRDRALRELELYLEANPSKRTALAADPGWLLEPLANDPRFRELMR